MTNAYVSREAVKRAVAINGPSFDAIIDQQISAASREIDKELGHRAGYFIPETKTRNFDWPQDSDAESRHVKTYMLRLDSGLISVSAITKEGADLVTLPTSEVFLEPSNEGPPYWRLEIDRATTNAEAVFEAGDTTQRAIRVTGSWGYRADTAAAGTVASGLASDAAATSFVCSNGALIDVGDTLLIQSEQLFVSARTNAQVASEQLTGNPTAAVTDTLIGVTTGSNFNAGEVILVDSERMYIESVSGNNLSVKRAYDGTAVAAHTSTTAVHAFRTLTVVRGVNGTTAATHANATAITKYQPPADIVRLCQAIAVAEYEKDKGGRTGVVGSGEGAVTMPRDPLAALWEKAKRDYGRSIALIL